MSIEQTEQPQPAATEQQYKPILDANDVTLPREELERREHLGSIDMYEKEKLQQYRQQDSEQKQKQTNPTEESESKKES